MKLTTYELYQLINNRLMNLVHSEYCDETIREIDFLWNKLKKDAIKNKARAVKSEQELEEALMHDRDNIYYSLERNEECSVPESFYRPIVSQETSCTGCECHGFGSCQGR